MSYRETVHHHNKKQSVNIAPLLKREVDLHLLTGTSQIGNYIQMQYISELLRAHIENRAALFARRSEKR